MGKMKGLRIFMAEDICNRTCLMDIDRAFVLADELWDRAMINKDPQAQEALNRFVKRWQKGE